MKTFSNYLNEAMQKGKKPFNSYVKEMFNTMREIKGFKEVRKVSVTTKDKEEANFEVRKYLSTKIPPLKNNEQGNRERTEAIKSLKKEYESLRKSVLLVLGCPSGIINSSPVTTEKYKSGSEISTSYYKFTDSKSGYNVSLECTLVISVYDDAYASFDVEYSGSTVKSQVTFMDHPEFVPGAILHSSWGYNMTTNDFYEIIRRSNKTVYAVKIGNKKVTGGGWTGREVPDPKVREKEVFSGRISDDGTYVTINKHLCRIYDGKPVYYNTMD